MKKALAVILSAGAAVFLLLCPKTASAAVSDGINACLEVIVPSLFAFSALSVFLQKSGLHRVVLKPFNFILSKILRLDEELCGIFLLANIGGYPVGISLLSALVKEERLSEKDAAKLMCCCFGSGPSFIIGIVGVRVFGSALTGLAIFAACLLSSLIMAVFVRAKGEITLKPAKNTLSITSEVFVSSVSSAARAMFSVSVMVAVFSVIAAALNEIGINSLLGKLFSLLGADVNSERIFPALLEVTRIKEIAPTALAMPLCAALLSFGGCCVFLQTASLSGKIPLKGFLLSRIPAALISFGTALLLSKILPPPDTETLAGAFQGAAFSKNSILSLCTLAMSGILLSQSRLRD